MQTVEIRTDDQNRYTWDIIQSTYTDGILSDEQITYDNGMFVQSTYLNGFLFLVSQQDSALNGGVKSWDTIETIYAPDGSMFGRVEVYDNGVSKELLLLDGVLTQTIQLDNPQDVSGNGAQSWNIIMTEYDATGAISERLTGYDDGIYKQEIFVNGVRSQTSQFDSQEVVQGRIGARNWDEVDTYFDASGQIAARSTKYDDGTFKEETFENGVRTHDRQIDYPQEANGTGVKNWYTFDRFFDETGQITARVIVYDDGRVLQDTYENGVRSYSRQLDNPQDADGTGVKDWDMFEQFYDDTGQLTARVINYDDGRLRRDTYENGVRATTEIQDNAYQGGTSQYNWTAMNLNYDENGDVVQKTTVYDDGRVRQDMYVDGVRSSSTIEDRFIFNGGNYDWDVQQYDYNSDGSVASRSISYDDGDAMLLIYANGKVAQKSEFDGDDSEAWVGRTTTYNDDGSVASTQTYDTLDDLPETDFGNLIPDSLVFG